MLKKVMTVVCLGLLSGTVDAGETFSAAGSTTIQPVVEKAVEQFKQNHPDWRFVVGGGGSSHGVKAVATGEVSLGLASRELKDKEHQAYENLTPVKIGLDGVAVIVNSKNPLTEITKQQVHDIYTGKITNWKELGGNDSPIILTAKEEGHSTLGLFLKYFDLESKDVLKGDKLIGMVHRAKGTEEYATVVARPTGANSESIAGVALKKNAIGYVSIGTAQEVAKKAGRIKLLDLDDVEATTDHVANGTYPLCRPLQVVTAGPAEGIVEEFIDFLTGPEGQKIVAELDFISVSQEIQ